MKRNEKLSLSLSENELGILDAIAKRMEISRSEVVRHLIIYQGLCGGEMPLTTRILGLSSKDRARVVGEIRAKAEANDPAKPQSFRQWVKDTLGGDDAATLEAGADRLLRRLLEPSENSKGKDQQPEE